MGHPIESNSFNRWFVCSWFRRTIVYSSVVVLLIVIPWYGSQWRITQTAHNEEKTDSEESRLFELQERVYEAYRITRSSYAKFLLRESLKVLDEILPNVSQRISREPQYDNARDRKSQPIRLEHNKCYTTPLDCLIEVLLYAATCDEGLLLIHKVHQFYPTLFVRVAVSGQCDLSQYTYNISHVQWHFYQTDGAHTWVRLATKARTKYVLVGRNLVHVSQYTNLDRPVRAWLCTGLADVVGGAVRQEPKGRWDLGCYQTSIRNFTLRIRPGYEESLQSCVYCDYITSPFLMERDLFLRVLGRSSLRGPVSMVDLFLRLIHSGLDVVEIPRIVSCLDILFHVAGPTDAHSPTEVVETIPESDWLTLARRWTLTDMILPRGVTHAWNCHVVGIDCKDFLEPGMLIPPCCLRERNQCLLSFLNLASAHHVKTRIYADSLVDMASPYTDEVPWQREPDLVWDFSRFREIDENIRFRLNTVHGCKLFGHCPQQPGSRYCSQLTLGSPHWNMTIHGDSVWFSNKPRETWQPTLINLYGLWTPTYFNPGLISANSASVSIEFASFEIEDHYWSSGLETAPFPYCSRQQIRTNCLSGNYLPLGNIQFHELDV